LPGGAAIVPGRAPYFFFTPYKEFIEMSILIFYHNSRFRQEACPFESACERLWLYAARIVSTGTAAVP
jgi:hypothetical protein